VKGIKASHSEKRQETLVKTEVAEVARGEDDGGQPND